MADVDQFQLAPDHKNPSYDTDEDGIVEESQLPGVTGLNQGTLTSGDFLKFDGTSLVGETVSTASVDSTSNETVYSVLRSSGTTTVMSKSSPVFVKYISILGGYYGSLTIYFGDGTTKTFDAAIGRVGTDSDNIGTISLSNIKNVEKIEVSDSQEEIGATVITNE